MMKEIYNRLGLTSTLDEESRKFVKRISVALAELESVAYVNNYNLSKVSRKIALALGEDIRGYLNQYLEPDAVLADAVYLAQVVIDLLRAEYRDLYDVFWGDVAKAFEYSVVNLGYRFERAKFTKTGAEELDQKLLLEPLDWLRTFPNSGEAFERSLTSLLRNELKDAVTNSYSSFESLAKTILRSDKSLDSDESRRELVKSLELEKEWGQMFYWYCKSAHEFSSRHGQREGNGSEVGLTYELAEFYVYMTGTFIRLTIQRVGK